MSARKTLELAVAATALTGIATLVSSSATAAQEKATANAAASTAPNVVALHTDSPIVAIRLMFRVGSIDDPAGKEGLAALTAMTVGQGGTTRRTYTEIIEALYPMAAQIGVNTDREVTVFAGQVHREKLADFGALLHEVLTDPGFRQEDVERNREQLLAYLTTTLRSANDELLGLELIQQEIYENHPYEHSPAGTVQGLRNITVDDVRAFYRQQFTRDNLSVGIAGGYPDTFEAQVRERLQRLPEGGPPAAPVPAPSPSKGRNISIYEKNTDSVAIHIGFPLSISREDPDYYALMVANSYFGEHRTFHGRLMQQLRSLRGLNYGDYSYIEYWDNAPGTSNPPPNVPRQQQYFSVWVRPVVPATAHFALRTAIAEIDRLIKVGLTAEEFNLTREFLVGYSKLWARTLSDRLGFHLDSRFYGMAYYVDEIEQRLRTLTVQDVNAAVKKHLQTENFEAVLVAANAAALKTALEKDAPSPIKYQNPVPPEVTKDDAAIQKLPIKPTSVRIIPVSQAFEK
jgi:zinc protease